MIVIFTVILQSFTVIMNLQYYQWQCTAIDSTWELRQDEWLQFDRNLIVNICSVLWSTEGVPLPRENFVGIHGMYYFIFLKNMVLYSFACWVCEDSNFLKVRYMLQGLFHYFTKDFLGLLLLHILREKQFKGTIFFLYSSNLAQFKR
jgi:hypothetical protein